MAAIVGGAGRGLPPTLAAAMAGKRVLVANKESLVLAGRCFVEAARERSGATLVPIDSEHNAIFSVPAVHFAHAGYSACGSAKRILLTRRAARSCAARVPTCST
jgi:1-deoxy-D-xylulose-5-phosphate reductoisomerase